MEPLQRKQFYLPPVLLRRLEQAAQARGVSLSEYIRLALHEHLEAK
ncbi:CopG family transcriptional regulator [Paraburkholderia unamae]|uniref:CopG family transcriptional regulator n=1 Tax=Paraburkholderia unamae TaxID=219649 RepID=A0ACC6RGW6_9BURK